MVMVALQGSLQGDWMAGFRWLELRYVILYILIITIAMVWLLYTTNSPPFGEAYVRW
jgi:hypothetical protein